MSKKQFSIPAKILLTLFTAIDMLPQNFGTKRVFYKKNFSSKIKYQSYANALNWLERKGVIKIYKDSAGQLFAELTQKGQIETLLLKARLGPDAYKKWDGKWRLIIFDIPEETKDKRNLLRDLLKRNGFYKLQASVYINPYPLNREAVVYLKETGLIKYIRILKVEEMDTDLDLKKYFGLV